MKLLIVFCLLLVTGCANLKTDYSDLQDKAIECPGIVTIIAMTSPSGDRVRMTCSFDNTFQFVDPAV